jgi:hypothetical protein
VRFRVDLKRSREKLTSCGKALQVPFSGFSYSLVRCLRGDRIKGRQGVKPCY